MSLLVALAWLVVPPAQLCAEVLTAPGFESPRRPLEAVAVCLEVGFEAQAHGVDPAVAVALAYSESRFHAGKVSPRGAVGALQIRPRWWCPDGRAEGCNLTQAGITALGTLRRTHGPQWRRALCHYNCGNECFPRGLAYADTVLRRAKRLRRTRRRR